MNIVTQQVVDTKAESNAFDIEMKARLEALKELSTIELAYVGGGQAVVSFV